MLVLSRRPGQSILIGKDIEIVVLGSDGVQVRVGIRAPREVTVLRRELLKQVEEENKRASAMDLGTMDLGAALGQLGAQAFAAAVAGPDEAHPPAVRPSVARPTAVRVSVKGAASAPSSADVPGVPKTGAA